ncbi:transcription factor S-II, central domain-containing protein, partial [Dichomitus squalens]
MQDVRSDDVRVTRASSSAATAAKQKARAEAEAEAEAKAAEEPESDASSEGSEEYNPQADNASKVRLEHSRHPAKAHQGLLQRRARRSSYHSDGGSDSDGSHRAGSSKRIRRASSTPKEPARKQSSPTPNHLAKRKKSTSAQPAPPPAKRPRSESTAGEDAARKYCLTKLQELFRQIFTRYPFLAQRDEGDDTAGRSEQPDKKPEELTSEEKEQLEAKANQFGVELENCMYELYSEPDKSGKQVVGGKYKERFRMLTFNLSKADRVVLHMRIASSHITPKELSTMSSTDLASESEKQSIKKLEEEALAHSILKKSIVPRAKLT